MTHAQVVKKLTVIEQMLFDLKKDIDPYANEGSATLFDAIQSARLHLEAITTTCNAA